MLTHRTPVNVNEGETLSGFPLSMGTSSRGAVCALWPEAETVPGLGSAAGA